jgi:hypothetical protein
LSGEEKFCPACGGATGTETPAEEKVNLSEKTVNLSEETVNLSEKTVNLTNESAQDNAPLDLPVLPAQTTERCPRCGQILTAQDTECPFCNYTIVRQNGSSAPFYAPSVEKKKKGVVFAILSVSLASISPFFTALFLLFTSLPLSVSLFPFLISAGLGVVAIYRGKKSENSTAIIMGIVGISLSVVLFILTILLFIVFLYFYLAVALNLY